VRELSDRFAKLNGAPEPRLERLDRAALAALAEQNPVIGELAEMLYATENPHILDSTTTERTLGVVRSPLDEVLVATTRGLGGAGRLAGYGT